MEVPGSLTPSELATGRVLFCSKAESYCCHVWCMGHACLLAQMHNPPTLWVVASKIGFLFTNELLHLLITGSFIRSHGVVRNPVGPAY